MGEECKRMDQQLRDLIDLIHFAESASTKIHGLPDEDAIYEAVIDEFAQSDRYVASILLLTGDGSELEIAGTSLLPERLKAGEKAAGLRLEGYKIDLDKSRIYSDVVREGKTVLVGVRDTIDQLFPRPAADLISKATGYDGTRSILTPLTCRGKTIGVLATSSTHFAEDLIPSVRNLGQHISSALELVAESARRKEAEAALRRACDELSARVSERTAELAEANETLRGEIGEREHVERMLRKSEERYRAVSEAMSDFVYALRVEPDGTIVPEWTAGAILQITGFTLEELNTRGGVVSIVHSDDRPRMLRRVQKLLSGQPDVSEYRVVSKGDQVRWIRNHGHPMWDEAQSRVVRIYGAAKDVTDNRRVADALRESEETARALLNAPTEAAALIDRQGTILAVNTEAADRLGKLAEELVGACLYDLFAPDVAESRKAQVGEVVRSGKAVRFQDERAGRVIDCNIYPVFDGLGQVARLAVFGHDITDRVQAEEKLLAYHDHLEELVRERSAELAVANERMQGEIIERSRAERLLLALSQAAQAVQRARTPEDVYRTTGDELASLGYQAAVHNLTEDRTHLAVAHLTYKPALLRAAEELTGLSAKGYSFPLVPGGAYESVIAGRKTIFTLQALEYYTEALPKLVRPLARRLSDLLGMEPCIVTPLAIGDAVVGLLAVSGGNLTEADVPAITAFTNQASIALENTQLLGQVRAAEERLGSLSHQLMQAQEAERRRIARGLHDEIGQALTALRVNLQAVQRSVNAPDVTSRLEDSIELADDACRQVRDLSLDLRPSLLDDLGLVPALRWYIDRQAQRAEFIGHLSAGPALEKRLPNGVKIACFRTVQEALTNVARHARAERVDLELREWEGELLLIIQDDGVGFNVEAALEEAAHGRSLGLLGLQERVRLTGGKLEIESAPGQGVTIRARFPLPQSSSASERDDQEHSR